MIYAHRDNAKWGERFVFEALNLGVRATLFDSTDEVAEGSKAFVRMSQQPQEVDICNSVMAALIEKNCVTIPTAQEAILYDNKARQFSLLYDYMPATAYITEYKELSNIARNFGFPLISKSREGASSKNVRILRNTIDLMNEAMMIFNGDGYPISYGRKQKGYMLLQEFVPDNDCDYRIIFNGRFCYGIIRGVRSEEEPFASGSGKITPITKWTGRAASALEFCHHIHTEVLGSEWMAYDVVFGKDNTPYLLEISSAWAAHLYEPCPALMLHDDVWINSDYTGADMFRFAVEVLRGEDML